MADAFRLIIDNRPDPGGGELGGLPHAAGYYTFFPREPSPEGTMTLSEKTTAVLTTTTLSSVLDEMLKVSPGGVVMLVCHAFADASSGGGGLLFKLAQGGNFSADTKRIKALDEIDGKLTKVLAILQMPEQDAKQVEAKKDALRDFLNKDTQNVVSGDPPLDQLKKLEQSWIDGEVTGRLGIPSANSVATFQGLMNKVKQVRALALARVELRACNLGGDKEGMKAVKALFGCKKLLAPKAITFHTGPFAIFPQVGKLSERLKPLAKEIKKEEENMRTPGPVNGPVYATVLDTAEVLKTTKTRAFQAPMPPALNTTPKGGQAPAPVTRTVFHLSVREKSAFHFAVEGATVSGQKSAAWNEVAAFVNLAVMPGSKYSSGTFPLAGFFLRHQDPAFVLPGEAEYLKQIVTLD